MLPIRCYIAVYLAPTYTPNRATTSWTCQTYPLTMHWCWVRLRAWNSPHPRWPSLILVICSLLLRVRICRHSDADFRPCTLQKNVSGLWINDGFIWYLMLVETSTSTGGCQLLHWYSLDDGSNLSASFYQHTLHLTSVWCECGDIVVCQKKIIITANSK